MRDTGFALIASETGPYNRYRPILRPCLSFHGRFAFVCRVTGGSLLRLEIILLALGRRCVGLGGITS